MSRPPTAGRGLFEASPRAMREMIDQAAERVVEHVATLASQPASFQGDGEAVSAAVEEPLPEAGSDLPALLDLLFDRLIPASYNTAGPGFLAYIPGGGLVEAAVGDLIAGSANRYATVWRAAPGLFQIEANVIRWFCDLMGYPERAGGFLSSGGSQANFSALVAARQERLPEDFLRGTLYVSAQIHHSVVKAAMLAGFPQANVRRVEVDARFRLRPDRLEQQIRDDRRRGFQPFLVVGSAGTTNTGAVDDLEALAAIAGSEELWLHVDAAYGGFFALTERGRQRLAGIGTADSITLDPHKGLFLPYGTGCLLVRDVAALQRSHGLRAEYMPPPPDDPRRIDFCDLSSELSRDFRGLRVWLPLKLHGAGAFRRALDEKLDLAEWAARRLAEIHGVEVVAEPQLSLVVFRLRPESSDREAENRRNLELLERINARQNVFLTGTRIGDGIFVLRICVLSFRTHLDRMETALDDVRRAVVGVRGSAREAG